jgi:two-component system, LytTR family, response regulator
MQTNITALIVDDEQRSRTVVSELIKKYCPLIKLLGECSSTAVAKEKIKELSPKLVFLDISMPGQNAFEMLQELGEVYFEIIFITAHSSYSIQAFRYSAVDYLLKPVQEDLFIKAVQKAQQKLGDKVVNSRLATLLHNFSNESNPYGKRICIPGIKGFQVIQVNEIMYLEAESCYTNFYLADKRKITSAKTLADYEEIIDEPGFLRVHKSFVVNLNYIKEYVKGDGGYILLNDGKEIEVSRRKKDFFLSKMKELFKL